MLLRDDGGILERDRRRLAQRLVDDCRGQCSQRCRWHVAGHPRHPVDPWRPILRSNAVNLHPVFYGLYEGHDLPPRIRIPSPDRAGGRRKTFPSRRTRNTSIGRHVRTASPIREIRPRHAKRLARLALDSARSRRLNAYIRKETRRSDEIYEQICSDPDSFARFEVEDRSRLQPATVKWSVVSESKPRASNAGQALLSEFLDHPLTRGRKSVWAVAEGNEFLELLTCDGRVPRKSTKLVISSRGDSQS